MTLKKAINYNGLTAVDELSLHQKQTKMTTKKQQGAELALRPVFDYNMIKIPRFLSYLR